MLTPLEGESLEVFRNVVSALTARFMTHAQYVDMIAMVRVAIRKLENKDAGCATGRHARACACGSGVETGVKG